MTCNVADGYGYATAILKQTIYKNHHPSITEAFPVTQGLTQLTILLECGICHMTI